SSLFGLFAADEGPKPKERLPDVAPWSIFEQLNQEKAVLGFYLSSHPIDQYRQAIESYSNTSVADLPRLPDGALVVLGGLVTAVKQRVTQRGRSAGQTMAIVTLEDKTGSAEVVVFSEIWAKYSGYLKEDKIVFVLGKLQQRENGPSLMPQRVLPIEKADELAKSLHVVLFADRLRVEAEDNENKISPLVRT
ncbi:MAG: hypothetical protein HC794_09030, partial [Nitrospiraceae bacterium]|nr:hypothetical protein [Nitrospiraceae bacterium]